MTIQNIISNAIKRLKEEGKLFTPDFYAEAFCKEAAKAKMQVEDCSHLKKFQELLTPELQKELQNYRINTLNEFTRFLISKLNRTNKTLCSETLESQTMLTKRVLQVVEVLHNKEASALARQTIDLLANSPKPEQLDNFRQSWLNFLTNYDDTFLQTLKSLGKVDTQDLRATIENLQNIDFGVSNNSVDLEKVARFLVASFVPSIASSVNDKIAELSDKLLKKPQYLNEKEIEDEIKSIISLRIRLDKNSLQDMISSIDGVLDKLSNRLIDMMEKTEHSNEEIQEIKKELDAYEKNPEKNFQLAHKRLYSIAVALEKNTASLSQELNMQNVEVAAMDQKIRELEQELSEVKKESKEDFLTKLYNKRALKEQLENKEAEFERFERDFCVVMFDLDHFKNINDNFGHEAGDAVLSAFARILKANSRSVDIIGRYGGEEFMALLSEIDKKSAAIFANKVREHVKRARFIYKGKRIPVTVSGGIGERKECSSLKDTINHADKLLYKAKDNGRDRVEY